MANMPNLVLECHFCSTRFQSLTQNLGNIFNLPQPYENAWLFDRASNVYWEEGVENPFTTLISVAGQEGSTQMTLTNVSCSGCGTPCGLKIVAVGLHPLFRRGQYIL
eukprot:XP_019081154.1 PREDICTED: uncharacterized protein LOC109124069 [Vitis vinifera]